MPFRFDPTETVQEAVGRCGREQLELAELKLGEEIEQDPVEAVHAARKALKKERALLRLTQGATKRSQRRRENAALRDAARGLSGPRDGDVMLGTLDDLSERYAGQVADTVFSAFRTRLEADRELSAAAANATKASVAATEVGAVRERLERWQLRCDGWEAISPGLRQTYTRGRRALRRVESDRSPEQLHAWRKRSKDLWYQLRLLAPVCGGAVKGQADDAHALADLLGDDHDLAVLRQTLIEVGDEVPSDLDALLGLIAHRREDLQRQAMVIGRWVYAERPAAFVKRLGRYWEAGRARIEVAEGHRPRELAQATRASASV